MTVTIRCMSASIVKQLADEYVEKDDFELDPFNKNGGLGRMWQLFGEETEEIINELNEVLAA